MVASFLYIDILEVKFDMKSTLNLLVQKQEFYSKIFLFVKVVISNFDEAEQRCFNF